MYIITLNNGLVLAKCEKYLTTKTGQTINVDDGICYGFKVYPIAIDVEEIPTDLVPRKYVYTEEAGFTIDSSYVDPSEQIDLSAKLNDALDKIAELEDAICDLSTELDDASIEEEVTE